MPDDKGYLLPEGDIDGYPLICVTMKIPDTPEYRRDFIGHMWLLGKWWTWQHGTRGDTRATRAAEYWRGLLFDWFTIGDCPVDCCDDILAQLALLQQGFLDQNALNLTNQVTASDIASQGLRDALEERYDGTPTSINPNAPTTNFGAAGDRFDALCAGITAFVYGFARIQIDHVRIAQIGGLAIIALTAGLLIPGLNFFLLVGASVAVLLGLGTVGVTTEVAIAALADHDALGHVICCMRDYLKDLAVTEANWDACLSACSFAGGSHEQIIADFIGPTLPQNYLTILNILGQAYTGVINGEDLPECPCPPPYRYPITYGVSGFAAQVLAFIGYDGDYDVWQVMTCDCPTTIVMDNGLQYNHGYNVKLVSGAAFSIDDTIADGNSLWALWLDVGGALPNARHFPNNVGPGQSIAQGHTGSNILCHFRIKPR